MSQRIVIVGGGFTGLLAARKIAAQHHPQTDITLIDVKDHFLFTPRLVDALSTSCQSIARWCAPFAELATRYGFTFLQGRVEHVNRENKTLTVFTESTGIRTVTFDTLVLCSGVKTCYYRIAGAEAHVMPLKTVDDIDHIQQRAHTLLQQAQTATSSEDKRRLLSFIVVGAGPSGVEGIFSLQQYVKNWCKDHAPELVTYLTFSLIQAGPQILPGFPLKIVNLMTIELQRQSIRIFLGEAVIDVSADAISTSLKHVLPASLVIWTAGIEPNKVTMDPEAHRDRIGYFIVDRFLQVEPSIFAAGDTVLYREHNQIIPRNAQTAIMMGRALGNNISRLLQHQSLKPFTYRSKGNILVVGKTGYLDLKLFSIKSRFAPLIRDIFYRFRFWQITGKF